MEARFPEEELTLVWQHQKSKQGALLSSGQPSVSPQAVQDLYEINPESDEQGSLIITSKRAFEEWGEIFEIQNPYPLHTPFGGTHQGGIDRYRWGAILC
jgi:hypothetical protein